ncbi:MAG TPA: Xaa-Pro peptidase family protein [Bacteroidota bacterium]|nr:Xaa-Pro peptidase family protein [Bacteroidota bacterium]
MNARRLEAVRQKLKALQLDGLLVAFIPHVRYLTNFSGSNGLVLITSRQQLFLTDGRYTAQSRDEVKGYRRVITGRNLFQELKQRIRIPSGFRFGIDQMHITVAEMESLRHLFPKAKFVPADTLVDSFASVKLESEIDRICKAISISERVFYGLLSVIKEGVSELDVAAEIVYQHRKHGAEAEAFEPIVASGERGALPHARASSKKIRKGELVTIDFGCRVNGYHSDLTRTVAVGRISTERRRIYNVVRDAQQRALDESRDRMKGKELDAIARRHIRDHKLGKFFTHSLGHGLGLQVHESPRISAISEDILVPGNVITIEPGVYVAGIGGVRIEDDVAILKGGHELLSTIPKDLITL